MNNVNVIASGTSFELYADQSVDEQAAKVTLSVSWTTDTELPDSPHGSLPGNQKLTISRDVMDDLAVEWVKKRHLQGKVIGPLAIWLM